MRRMGWPSHAGPPSRRSLRCLPHARGSRCWAAQCRQLQRWRPMAHWRKWCRCSRCLVPALAVLALAWGSKRLEWPRLLPATVTMALVGSGTGRTVPAALSGVSRRSSRLPAFRWSCSCTILRRSTW